jgi:hypothetical protein
VALSLLLSLAVLAADKSTSKQAKAPSGPPEVARDQGKTRPQMRERMDPAAQLETLKKEHQAALGELQAIKQLAVKEKATQTAAALDKLMARREQEFQKRIEPLQQRLKRVEGEQKGQEKAAEASPKAGAKQSQKGDGTKTKTSR